MQDTATLRQAELAVLVTTLAYVAGFGFWFVLSGNFEFLFYIAVMVGMIALVAFGSRSTDFPAMLLWALSLWGFAHMAGGGVMVKGDVLYNLTLLNIAGNGELRFLKYDQLVHAYGFGVTAWALWHILMYHYPQIRGTWTSLTFPALASMGLGSANEMIEFASVLMAPANNVGGYLNTSLDLVMNAAGAVIAMTIIGLRQQR